MKKIPTTEEILNSMQYMKFNDNTNNNNILEI